jgi:hypothetical protein
MKVKTFIMNKQQSNLIEKKNLLFYYSENLGRGKLKKMIPSLLAGLIGKKIFAVLPLFLVGIALLSVKALITAKIAFMLALISAVSGKGGSSGGSAGGIGGIGGILGKVAGLSGGLGGGSSSGS